MKWRRGEGGKDGRLSMFPCVCVLVVQTLYPHLFIQPFIACSYSLSVCVRTMTKGEIPFSPQGCVDDGEGVVLVGQRNKGALCW